MVNVNNYGVSGTNYTTNYPKGNQGQQASYNVPNNQVRKPDDKYAFESNNMAAGKVPTIGMWDKMSSYFKDVMNTPQNLQSFKNFETSIKSNPQGFLQPGSTDMGRVKDVQTKLNYLGMNMTVNGQFGSATEQAIIRFKKSVGINDGFLDKSGQWAVTPIVTPQTWSLLNSQVANKLNPSTNLANSSFKTPVTPQEMDWAKGMANKIQQFGYKPSEPERQRYENIYQRASQNGAVATQTQQPQAVTPPSDQEMNWAKGMANKVQQQGYKPTQQEIVAYQNIFNRNKAANEYKAQAQNTKQVQQTQQPQANQGGVSPAEMSWATSLMQRVQQGYKPTADEQIKYQGIFDRSKVQQTTQTQAPQQNNSPVTQNELTWAKNLETKVSQGYNPTQQEKDDYQNIYTRSQGGGATAPTQQTQQQSGTPVTQDELAWAQDLENKVNTQGYKPTQQEVTAYENIFNRAKNQTTPSQTQQPVQNTQTVENSQRPSQQEVNWALELEQKSKTGYQPTQSELAMYNDIASRLTNNSEATQQVSQNNTQVQQPVNQPDISNEQPVQDNSVSNEPFSYNQSTINNFKSAFPGVSFKGNSVPYLPTNVAKQVATDYGFTSVSELQSAIGASVDGKFGPETFFKLDQAKRRGNQSPEQTQTRPVQNATSVSQTSNAVNQNGVTQAELDWAVGLQDKFSQGYNPTQDEQVKYTDIFKRYQDSGNQVIEENTNTQATSLAPTQSNTSAPTQQEVDWASNLQVKIGQGHQPSQHEVAQYTDIFNRYQANDNQVSQQANQPAQTTQQNGGFIPPQSNQSQYNLDPNTPTVGVDTSRADQNLQWALELLDKVQQQGYVPTNEEASRYEQVIAQNQSTLYRP